MNGFDYTATPTGEGFHLSERKVRVLAGPIGGGKSVTCVMDILAWAMEQQPDTLGTRRTRFAIIRNTVDQLKTTTMKTLMDWLPPGIYGEHRIVDKTYILRLSLDDGTRVESELLFLSLDNPADTRKALSLELTGVWLNEAREIHPDVIEVMVTRTGRYPKENRSAGYGCTRSGMIMDTNMPSAESWFGKRMQDEKSGWDVHIQPPAAISPEAYLAKYGESALPEDIYEDFEGRRWVINPDADNLRNLKEDYYPVAISGKSKDFVDVYVLSRYGRELGGAPVYENVWKSDFHILANSVGDKPLALISDEYPIVIGLDFGRTPSAILLQGDPRGRITALCEVLAENCGIERFLKDFLKPVLMQTRFARCSFVVAPDPAGFHKQQLGEVSLVDVVKQAGFKVSRPVSNDPEKRIAAVEQVLMEQVDGKARFRVSSECRVLIKGFEDGYRYRQKKNGELEASPDKNKYSHPHDALQYGIMVAVGGVTGWAMGGAKAREIEIVDSGGWV
jgi:hypothetical protein